MKFIRTVALNITVATGLLAMACLFKGCDRMCDPGGSEIVCPVQQ